MQNIYLRSSYRKHGRVFCWADIFNKLTVYLENILIELLLGKVTMTIVKTDDRVITVPLNQMLVTIFFLAKSMKNGKFGRLVTLRLFENPTLL